MRKLVNLQAIIRDIADRKRRAAKRRSAPPGANAEAPRAVYQAGCAAIAAAFAPLGFRYASSGPHFTRKVGELLHGIYFSSSHNNVAGEYVAVWIYANVRSPHVARWRAQFRPGTSNPFVAGGQIGNLAPQAAWLEWDLADPDTRPGEVAGAIATIRQLALPFFEVYASPAATKEGLYKRDLPGLHALGAIEFALAFEDRPLAQRLLARSIKGQPDRLKEYEDALAEFRRSGLPPYWSAGSPQDLAKATLLYGLEPV